MSVGEGAAKDRGCYIIGNLCTLASFGQSAPRKMANILHRQYRVIGVALSVFGWHVLAVAISCITCV